MKMDMYIISTEYKPTHPEMLLNKNIQNIPDLHQRLWLGTDGFYPYNSRQI